MLTLDLALITYGIDGIRRVASMNLPEFEGVRYVVSWQAADEKNFPQSLNRDDITVVKTDTHGAAINRNNAMSHCTADIVLFADDDIIYTADGLRQVIDVFNTHPDIDLVTFEATHPCKPKYPKSICRLEDPLPRGYWVSAYQIAFRRKAIGDLLCHPEFGAGAAKFTGADDELFLLSAIRRRLKCFFFPINICTHPDLSTGTTTNLSRGNLRAIGCYITIAYPRSFLLRLPLKAWRIYKKRQAGLFHALRYIIAGAVEAPRIMKSDRRYLW